MIRLTSMSSQWSWETTRGVPGFSMLHLIKSLSVRMLCSTIAHSSSRDSKDKSYTAGRPNQVQFQSTSYYASSYNASQCMRSC